MNGAERFFIDTNVLLYSISRADEIKYACAVDWLERLWFRGDGRLSWQVLHEFYWVAVRKLKAPCPLARRTVQRFEQWHPQDTSMGLIQRAWHWADAAQLSYWDGLIVAAAERQGCRYLLTEDLQEGRDFEGVMVVNPFRSRPESVGLHI